MNLQISHQIKSGIFVGVGLLLILLSIFFLGGESSFTSNKVILFAEFDHVQGLARGSVVSLSGLNVGNVKDIEFIPSQNKLRVKMTVQEKYLSRITEGSAVEIRTQGALGDKFVFIQPGDISATAVQPGSTLATLKASDFIGVLAERGNEANKFFEIIGDLQKFTRALTYENRADHILENLKETSKSLKETAAESRLLVAELRAGSLKDSAQKLNHILAKIDRGEGSLGALINDPSLHESLKNMVGGNQRKKTIKSLLRGTIEKGEEQD